MPSLNYYANLYAAGKEQEHDIGFKRRIKAAIKYYRAMLVRREFERKPKDIKLKQHFFTTVEESNESLSCDIPTNCKVLIARDIPVPLSTGETIPFSYVGFATKSFGFDYTTMTRLVTEECERFKPARPRYLYDSAGIRIITDIHMFSKIKVSGYFEDPTLVNNLCAESDKCFKDDEEFPIGQHMIQTIFDGFDRGEFRIIPEDNNVTINDEAD